MADQKASSIDTNSLEINPCFTWQEMKSNEKVIGYDVAAPLKGLGVRRNQIFANQSPAIFKVIGDFVNSPGAHLSEFPPKYLEVLKGLGVAVQAEQAPKKVEFSCTLSRDLLPLVPSRLQNEIISLSKDRSNLILNSSFFFGGEKPPKPGPSSAYWQRVLSSWKGMAEGRQMGWIENPGSKIVSPYWLSPEMEKTLRDLQTGRTRIDAFDETTIRVLVAAEILVPKTFDEEQIKKWAKICEEGFKAINGEKYTVFKRSLPALQMAALRRYYREQISEGHFNFQADIRIFDRHDEGIARYFHFQFEHLFSHTFQTPVRPSFCYTLSYLSGSVLQRHKDREECRFAMSLTIDFKPDDQAHGPWPIYMEHKNRPGETHSVDLEIGDAVVYKGNEVYHWRDALPEGRTLTSLTAFFVPPDYDKPLK